MHDAVADHALEVTVAPRIVIATQTAIQFVGWRLRHDDTDERVKVFQIIATEGQLQTEILELKRIDQAAARMCAGGACLCLQVDTVRLVLVAEFQWRLNLAGQGERAAGPASLALDIYCG